MAEEGGGEEESVVEGAASDLMEEKSSGGSSVDSKTVAVRVGGGEIGVSAFMRRTACSWGATTEEQRDEG